MLKISRLADYATRILFLLAGHPERHFSATQVSQETFLAVPTVSKILKLLHEGRLVNSERGVNGGYQLARAPEAIGIADIIAAIDGRVAVTECNKGDNICEHSDSCELKNNWRVVNNIILNVLQNLTLANMRRPLDSGQCVCRQKPH